MTQSRIENDDDGVSFISDDYEIAVTIAGETYRAVYIIEEGHVRLFCYVDRQRYSKHVKLSDDNHRRAAESLLHQIVGYHKRDLDDFYEVLAEVDRLLS